MPGQKSGGLTYDLPGVLNEYTKNPMRPEEDLQESAFTHSTLSFFMNTSKDAEFQEPTILRMRICRVDEAFTDGSYDVKLEAPARVAVSSVDNLPWSSKSDSHGLTNLQITGIYAISAQPNIGDEVLVRCREFPMGGRHVTVIKTLVRSPIEGLTGAISRKRKDKKDAEEAVKEVTTATGGDGGVSSNTPGDDVGSGQKDPSTQVGATESATPPAPAGDTTSAAAGGAAGFSY